jgi:preprotein translocase subunit SecA
MLVEAFALVREAANRTLKQRPFDEQIMGGVALFEGAVVEMKTGEGKTLTATFPAFLHGLTGKGVHIVTVNDYLAELHAVWMGQIYDALGLSVSCILHEASFRYDPSVVAREPAADEERDTEGAFKVVHEFLRPISRREAYRTDITYGTNHEFGFDYLRDNLVYRAEQIAQRDPYFAIVDEVDNILIDEARTPLIISGPDEDAGAMYKEFARIAPRFAKDADYTVDEKRRQVMLTEQGIDILEKILGRDIYRDSNLLLIHHFEQSLRAEVLYHRDHDYVVKDGEVIIVDEFTGRMLHGRRFSEGLHQALEAKERVRIQQESRTYATITLQNYFRMYPILSGMSGTALTSAEEFHKVYGLDCVGIPTHQPMIRADLPDKVFMSEAVKLRALVKEIKERHDRGQPLLVGTISIQKNEYLSALLKREGIPFQLLNAKQHEQEGAIIAQAGRPGAVMVATNMAGRGVDIILGGNPPDAAAGDAVRGAGGLHVIGTERHESRRIDNQLRGRSGRQGDVGSSQFFVSLDDDLMRIFGSDRLRSIAARLGLPADSDVELESRFVSSAIDAAQRKVEGINFDIRKHVLEFDDVLNRQRTNFYQRRRQMLVADTPAVLAQIRTLVATVVHNACASLGTEAGADRMVSLFPFVAFPGEVKERIAQAIPEGNGETECGAFLNAELEKKVAALGDGAGEFVRSIALQVMDGLWMIHLEYMESLREAVGLRVYGQRDALVEYRTEGHRAFRGLVDTMEFNTVALIFRAEIPHAR